MMLRARRHVDKTQLQLWTEQVRKWDIIAGSTGAVTCLAQTQKQAYLLLLE